MKKQAAGLYYGDRLLTEVLVEEVASDEKALWKAMADFEKNPTIGLDPGETPFERKSKLQRATVRWFH